MDAQPAIANKRIVEQAGGARRSWEHVPHAKSQTLISSIISHVIIYGGESVHVTLRARHIVERFVILAESF